jgi:hypothetical protein
MERVQDPQPKFKLKCITSYNIQEGIAMPCRRGNQNYNRARRNLKKDCIAPE